MKFEKGKQAGTLYFIATLFNKGIAFLTIPIFSRILTTADFGIVTTYSSWVDIFTVVFSLALYLSIRTAFVDFEGKEISYLNTVISFTLLFGTIIGIAILGTNIYIIKFDIVLIILAISQGIGSAILNDYMTYLMMKLDYVKRTFFMIMPNFISVVLALLIINSGFISKRYMGRIWPMAIVYIIFGVIICIDVYKVARPKIIFEQIQYGLKFSLPLVLHGIALNILSQSDRTMITWLAGADQTGIYSLVYSFGMIATVITTALEGLWVPWFFGKLKNKSINDINKCAVDYIKLMTFAMIVLIMIGPEVYKFLADKSYWGGIKIIPPIVLANYMIFAYSLYVNVEHYYKKTKGVTVNTLIAAGCNIILNLIFIPIFGYVAAAYTTLVSYFVALLLHARCSKKIEKKVLPFKIFIMPFLEILGITLIYYLLLNMTLIRWSILIVLMCLAIIKNRELIIQYLKK
nr:oligosaccharide flippase family protein [uncultured Anaerostipes sp.]